MQLTVKKVATIPVKSVKSKCTNLHKEWINFTFMYYKCKYVNLFKESELVNFGWAVVWWIPFGKLLLSCPRKLKTLIILGPKLLAKILILFFNTSNFIDVFNLQ